MVDASTLKAIEFVVALCLSCDFGNLTDVFHTIGVEEPTRLVDLSVPKNGPKPSPTHFNTLTENVTNWIDVAGKYADLGYSGSLNPDAFICSESINVTVKERINGKIEKQIFHGGSYAVIAAPNGILSRLALPAASICHANFGANSYAILTGGFNAPKVELVGNGNFYKDNCPEGGTAFCTSNSDHHHGPLSTIHQDGESKQKGPTKHCVILSRNVLAILTWIPCLEIVNNTVT